MNCRFFIISLLVAFLGSSAAFASPFRYVGGDISLLPEYEKAGAKYLDENGKQITDLLSYSYDQGMNAMRVRLFVTPSDYTGKDKDPNACQDLPYIIPLCKRIKEDGFALMLDFHYSDTWADPLKQWTPAAWQGLTDMELYFKIYDYTKETLETLREEGIVPDFIQPGNEISYGMLWGPAGTNNPLKVYPDSDTNWSRFATLLRKAIQACREVCPDARIVIHNERVAKPAMLTGFFSKIEKFKIDYDIIGLSYYPYFHGKIGVLDTALNALEADFPEKEIMIVETGYAYAWEVQGTDQEVEYPYSQAGQNKFAQDLVETLLAHESVTGLFWWWMEYNAYGTSLQNWYNAPLFDSRNGRVQKAFKTICSFGSGHPEPGSVGSLEAAPQVHDSWFDLQGRPLKSPSAPGLYINNGRKVLVK